MEKKLKKNSANMADIDKILNVKPKIKSKKIMPEQYWGYLKVFDENEINHLPNSWEKNKLRNRAIGRRREETNDPLGTVIQYVKRQWPNKQTNIANMFFTKK